MRRACAVLGLTLLAMTVCGCAEHTTVRSYPPGSKLFINDQLVGLTPVRFRIPPQALDREYRVRIERDGYQPAKGRLLKDLCPGRLVASIFTFGIFRLFKSSTCYVDVHDFSLTEIETVHGLPDAPSLSVEGRLQRIEKLREQGIITEDEFRRYREEVLRDL